MGRNNFFDDDFGDDCSYGSDREPSFTGMQERPVPKVYNDTGDINIDKALADQYAEAESFRDHMLNNSNAVKPTDVTSSLTAVNRILQQIINMREAVQNLARMQAFEAAVVQTMKKAEPKVRDAFFAQLEELLKDVK